MTTDTRTQSPQSLKLKLREKGICSILRWNICVVHIYKHLRHNINIHHFDAPYVRRAYSHVLYISKTTAHCGARRTSNRMSFWVKYTYYIRIETPHLILLTPSHFTWLRQSKFWGRILPRTFDKELCKQGGERHTTQHTHTQTVKSKLNIQKLIPRKCLPQHIPQNRQNILLYPLCDDM